MALTLKTTISPANRQQHLSCHLYRRTSVIRCREHFINSKRKLYMKDVFDALCNLFDTHFSNFFM